MKMTAICLLIALTLSGCSMQTGERNSSDTVETTSEKTLLDSTNYTKDKNIAQSQKRIKVIELSNVRLKVNQNWIIKKGLDSIAFFDVNGKSIGGIDILGYSKSIDDLIPNHSKVIEKREQVITHMIKAVSVVTSTDTLNSSPENNLHIFFVLDKKKIIYDLHFNLKTIDKTNALKIARTISLNN